MHKGAKNDGFTIVELLVVIVVIGILAAITIVSYTGISNKAISSSIQSDLTSASNQLKLYQVINSAYPTSVTDCPNPAAANICLKNSPGNNVAYQADNTSSSQTFNLKITNNNTRYYITNDSTPIAYTPVTSTGGTVTDIGNYRIHTFTSSGTFTVTTTGVVDVLVVAGGGGGGFEMGGGGGAGGLIYSYALPVTSGTAYPVTVGTGGTGRTSNADNTANAGNSIFASLTVIGGGAGGNNSSTYDGTNTGGRPTGGGSGGGDGEGQIIAPGTSGQGYAGGAAIESGYYHSGGGGGAGGAGNAGTNTGGGDGGTGIAFSFSGTLTYYAGGGAGGTYSPSGPTRAGLGGLGGGGRANFNAAGTSGIANTGGGGGGGSYTPSSTGGNGGSGIVIIRYLLP